MKRDALIRPLLLLSDEYVTTGEARLLGVTKISQDLVFHDIVELYDTRTSRLWRLTPRGMKIKQHIIEIMNLLKEVA